MDKTASDKHNKKELTVQEVDEWLKKAIEIPEVTQHYNLMIGQLVIEFSKLVRSVNQQPPEVSQTNHKEFRRMSVRYGRKVFLGGLPVGITDEELFANFCRFGRVYIDWPHKTYREHVPPDGYAFAIFEHSTAVNKVIDLCTQMDYKYLIGITTLDGQKIVIEVKPWELRNNELSFVYNWMQFDRLKVFVGGLPRTITAEELGKVFQEAVGGVAYVCIEIDEETEYPKGAARVVFSNQESYVRAIAMHEITVASCGNEKVAEIKPFIHNKMKCESCQIYGAPSFCPEVRCLIYLCDACWKVHHSKPGIQSHKPMQKGRYYFSPKAPRRQSKAGIKVSDDKTLLQYIDI